MPFPPHSLKIHKYPTQIQFCGSSSGPVSLDHTSLAYIRSVLTSSPMVPPKLSSDQWNILNKALRAHHILPFLYYKVSRLDKEHQPPDRILDKWRQSHQASSVRLLRMETQLAEIVTDFEQQGIQVLVLKGPALAYQAYPHPASRSFTDLDLLVLPETMVPSRQLLKQLGYRCMGERFEVSRQFYHEETFIPEDETRHPFSIELHWDLDAFSRVPSQACIYRLFERSIRLQAGHLAIRTLDPVDALIHRALKNAYHHHRDMRLIWLADVALLAKQLAVAEDWETLIHRCVSQRARLAMELSLRLASMWTDLEIPETYSDFSHHWPAPDSFERIMWQNAQIQHERLMSRIGWYLRDDTPMAQKVSALIHLLFPAPQYMQLAYPPAHGLHLPLAYIRRFQSWMKKYRMIS